MQAFDADSLDDAIRQVLQQHPAIHLAILFGSCAKGTARWDSDIDLAIDSGGRPLDSEAKARLIEALAQATGRPVDLVELAGAGEPLLGQILCNGRKLCGDSRRHAYFILQHLADQEDFVPYQRRILEQRRRAWIGM
jgi:predicted nucleotidyltransferase